MAIAHITASSCDKSGSLASFGRHAARHLRFQEETAGSPSFFTSCNCILDLAICRTPIHGRPQDRTRTYNQLYNFLLLKKSARPVDGNMVNINGFRNQTVLSEVVYWNIRLA